MRGSMLRQTQCMYVVCTKAAIPGRLARVFVETRKSGLSLYQVLSVIKQENICVDIRRTWFSPLSVLSSVASQDLSRSSWVPGPPCRPSSSLTMNCQVGSFARPTIYTIPSGARYHRFPSLRQAGCFTAVRISNTCLDASTEENTVYQGAKCVQAAHEYLDPCYDE